MLDYKLIEALATVIDEGGFEKAARLLHLTQSAVSQRVKLLEEQAGQVLLVRSSPPAPTEAGRMLLKHYRQVRRLEGDLRDKLLMDRTEEYERLAVGVNADSLATWFQGALKEYLHTEKVVLDILVDDQGQTHRMLRDGEVAGCVSAEPRAVQGCRVGYLGSMEYRLMATPDFVARFFPKGLTPKAIRRAPAVIYNRRDELQPMLFRKRFPRHTLHFPNHYVPSTEAFMGFLADGHGYGMLPVMQARELIEAGRLVDVGDGCETDVPLYWHCWNLQSSLLDRLSRELMAYAREHLRQVQ